eukprot:TRINITY_DN9636_c0_g1_i1.p1 TRINITY_DN9636_c0_g1~~TRINITY_DN9636_c0_g1_i1.p1  ORF type:complete len:1193 (-),score=324.17 TRINITY_DN9636_c0_g1_i1:46-3576(-)
MEAPLPLIYCQDEKFVLGEEAMQRLSAIKGDVAIVSVVGFARTGKSYLMNRLLSRQDGFSIGPTVKPCTKGIYIWGNPVVIDRNGEDLNVILVDTEGIGSYQVDATYDSKIFALAVLISSYFIYNSLGTIDKRTLEGLAFITNLTKHIQVNSTEDSTRSELSEYFPNFLWAIRDFVLDLQDDDGNPITSDEYLEESLSNKFNNRDGIGSTIKDFFPNRRCACLVRPVNDENSLRNIDNVPYEELRDEFKFGMEEVKRLVYSSVQPKKILGKSINGEGLSLLLESYINSINDGSVPVIRDAWTNVAETENRRMLEASLVMLDKDLDELLQDLVSVNTWESNVQDIKDKAKSYLDSSSMGDLSLEIRELFKSRTDDIYDKHVAEYNKQSELYCDSVLLDLISPLKEKLESREINSMKQFLDLWGSIRETYFKKAMGYAKWISLEKSHSGVTSLLHNYHILVSDEYELMIKNLEDKNHDFEKTLIKTQSENDQYINEINIKNETLENNERKIRSISDKNKELKSNLSDVTSRNSDLQKEIVMKDNIISGNEENIERKTEKINKLSCKKESLKQELIQAHSEIDKYENDLSLIQKNFEDFAANAMAKQEESKRIINNYTDKVAKLKKQISDTNNELENKKIDFDSLQHNNTLLSTECSNLENELADLNDKYELVKKSYRKKKTKNTQQKNEIDELTKTIKDLEIQYEKCTKANEALSLDNLKNEQIMGSQISQLTEELEAFETEHENMEIEWKREVSSISTLLEEQKVENEVLISQYDKKCADYSESQDNIVILKERIEGLLSAKENLNQNVSEKDGLVENLRKSIKCIEEENHNLKDQFRYAEKENEKVIFDLQRKYEESVNDLQEKDLDLNNFKQMYENATSNYKKSEDMVQTLKNELEEINSLQEHLQEENKRYSSESEKGTSDLLELQSLLKEKNNMYKELKLEFESVKEQLQADNNTVSNNFEKVKIDLEKALSELNLKENELSEMEFKHSETASNLEQAREDLASKIDELVSTKALLAEKEELSQNIEKKHSDDINELNSRMALEKVKLKLGKENTLSTPFATPSRRRTTAQRYTPMKPSVPDFKLTGESPLNSLYASRRKSFGKRGAPKRRLSMKSPTKITKPDSPTLPSDMSIGQIKRIIIAAGYPAKVLPPSSSDKREYEELYKKYILSNE